jgi:FkbM family methyltransferase
VTVDARAVSDRVGASGFQAPLAGHVWDGTGRLTAEAAPRSLGGQERREGQGRGEEEGQAGTIECTTLDAFVAERHIERLAFVKVDVEGWELSVLRGARRVLRALRPVVVFEYDPAYVSRSGGAADDVTRCWLDADYELFALDPRRPPELVERLGDRGGNFLALPRRAASDR